MSNLFLFHSRLSEYKLRELVRHFANDEFNASEIATKLKISQGTVNLVFLKIRTLILKVSERQNEKIYLFLYDTGYFSDPPQPILKSTEELYILVGNNNQKIFAEIISLPFAGTYRSQENIRATLISVLFPIDFVLCSLKKNGINKSLEEKLRSLTGYDFAYFVADRMKKFNGVRSDKLRLHIKECELRYNTRCENLYYLILDLMRKDTIKKYKSLSK